MAKFKVTRLEQELRWPTVAVKQI